MTWSLLEANLNSLRCVIFITPTGRHNNAMTTTKKGLDLTCWRCPSCVNLLKLLWLFSAFEFVTLLECSCNVLASCGIRLIYSSIWPMAWSMYPGSYHLIIIIKLATVMWVVNAHFSSSTADSCAFMKINFNSNEKTLCAFFSPVVWNGKYENSGRTANLKWKCLVFISSAKRMQFRLLKRKPIFYHAFQSVGWKRQRACCVLGKSAFAFADCANGEWVKKKEKRLRRRSLHLLCGMQYRIDFDKNVRSWMDGEWLAALSNIAYHHQSEVAANEWVSEWLNGCPATKVFWGKTLSSVRVVAAAQPNCHAFSIHNSLSASVLGSECDCISNIMKMWK